MYIFQGNYQHYPAKQGDETQLHLEICPQNKTVELWLTAEETNDPAFRAGLTPLYQKYRNEHLLVSVFLSGGGELYPQTRDLLLVNRRQWAERRGEAPLS